MKKVILMIDTSRGSSRQFLRGIESFIHSHEHWQLLVNPPYYISSGKVKHLEWINLNQADGIILRDFPKFHKLLSLDIPKIVFESKREFFPGITTVSSEHYNISKMAAEYFIGLGFNNFAYCGFAKLPWSKKRFEAYKEVLESNKCFRIFNYNCQHGIENTEEDINSISQWLKNLPKPLCVLACNDDRGISVLEASKIANLKVPEEVTVLGIDNDELICNLSYPPLSSIKLGFEKAGYEAADSLNKQMRGSKPILNIVAKTEDLIERQSSDIIAIDDVNIREALIFIRQNFQKAIQVRNVVDATSLSRRMLELRFKDSLKRSINDEINRQRIKHIKRRLINSHIPISKIAESLEFTDAEHFARFFKKLTSMSPKEYRHRFGSFLE